MLALIAETSWLYARLALSTAARNREREARLMSMDAVTAAISHEVGQPLTAVSLSASVGLHWLTQPRPDISKAITSLRAISDDSKRTFDVIKSIRAMFGKGGGTDKRFQPQRSGARDGLGDGQGAGWRESLAGACAG